jgi:simple sugar transport system ATP-binding protein
VAVIELDSIRKRFGETQALDGVSFSLDPGEIHALLGENGAGKTTAMNVLYGLVRPDSGSIRIDSRNIELASPAQAIRAGIGMVHQHFMLVPNLTVAENVLMGARERNPFWFDRRRANEEVRRLSDEFGIAVEPERLVGTLPVGVQQRVEILKCLARRARVLILDEPTAVLTPQEVDELGDVLRRLRNSGHAIVFISHKLKEVIALCDRVTVLRLGRNVGTVAASDVDERALSQMMVGRTLAEARPPRKPTRNANPTLEVASLVVEDDRQHRAVDGLDLDVFPGEIVGIAGIDGNGQSELVECLAGVRPATSGTVRLAGQNIAQLPPIERIRQGIALISDDRQRKGLVLDFTVAENLVLKRHAEPPFAERGFLRRRRVHEFADEAIRAFSVKAESVRVPVNSLSGGNQQKVVVARELSRESRLLIAVNPTRGLDVGATEYVYDALLAARERGVAILLISTELDEVMFLSDRIAVMFDGRVRHVLPTVSDLRTTIGQYMLGRGEVA